MGTRHAPSATETAQRLRLAVMRLARRLRQQTEEPVSPSQMSALHTIERAGPLTLGDLAAAERVQPPTITRVVASLEEGGYVTREVDPTDRRVARVKLTMEGRKLVERGRSRRTAYLAARLRRLSDEELEKIDAALPLIERMIEDER